MFSDKSQTFGNPDCSAQVAQMVDKSVDLVIPCLDANSAFTLGREMKKQGHNQQEAPSCYS